MLPAVMASPVLSSGLPTFGDDGRWPRLVPALKLDVLHLVVLVAHRELRICGTVVSDPAVRAFGARLGKDHHDVVSVLKLEGCRMCRVTGTAPGPSKTAVTRTGPIRTGICVSGGHKQNLSGGMFY